MLLLAICFTTISFAQNVKDEMKDNDADSTEVSGDNFSLEGALALFKKSNTLEDFEKALNEENNSVNNLDLNNDGNIDYVSVESIKDKDTRVIVLSTYLKDKEKQDIATIGIEKTGKEEATLQIIGDDDIYAKNTIVEPFEVDEKSEKSKGPNASEVRLNRLIVNVWGWSCVRYMYVPNYVVWNSPYYWGAYPSYWRPWRPMRYGMFYTRVTPYRSYYRPTRTFRVVQARNIYMPRRRTTTIIVHKNRGHKTTIIRSGKTVNGHKTTGGKIHKTPKTTTVKTHKTHKATSGKTHKATSGKSHGRRK